MEVQIDHYLVLGLPSGEEGSRLTEKEISKAYKQKALELHPDKRPDDPKAHENFQKLKSSYEILKDEKARKLFDDLLRVKREQRVRQSQYDTKRRKMMSDLEERERSAFAPDPEVKAREEEERIARKLKEEIARIRAMHANKGAFGMPAMEKDASSVRKERVGVGFSGTELDKEKVLKVSWEKIGEDYSSGRLRQIFEKFGKVEDVVIKSSKKKCSALVVMASKDAAVAATGDFCGDPSNPLMVAPLQQSSATPAAEKPPESGPDLGNLVGAGFHNFEDSVLKKLQTAAAKKK